MRTPLRLSKSRIEALSDGVFSITMTLLVLKLEVPDMMHHSSNGEMLDQLLALWPAFATYVITFLIAGGFWFLHHLTFHFIRHVNGVLLWVNLLFLMMVALLPFSAGLMSHLFIHPVSQYFYIGNQFAIAALLSAHWFYVKCKDLHSSDDPKQISRLTLRIYMTTVVFTVTMIMAVILPAWSWTPLPAFVLGALVFEWFRR
jgi:uncharacterized membrane protein